MIGMGKESERPYIKQKHMIHELKRIKQAIKQGGVPLVIHNTRIYMRVANNLLIKGKAETMSHPEERELFSTMLQQLKPQVVMEIGTAKGGMLQLFCKNSPPTATIISLDLPNGKHGGGYPKWMGWAYRWKFPKHGQKLHLITGDSKTQESVCKVADTLKGRQVDFLFIDADHTYEGVKSDFNTYKHFVRPGGIIAFHDINHFASMPDVNVDVFWSELCAMNPGKTATHIHRPQTEGHGIGIFQV
jgi:predicted O-methyltransferase YrrM